MDKKKAVASSSPSYSSSSSSSLDHLFGPRGISSSSSSTSSSTTGLFKSIFPPPSPGMGRHVGLASQVGDGKYHSPNEGGRSERGERNSGNYRGEEAQPCNWSSSIYYGGQENYSPIAPTSTNSFKKDGEDQGDSKSASRGNWWEGSLYY
ncbi:PREDICTED: uncharacterized protein LOC104810063 [Tarenaya hassleriana]|uniref:uncharacterized protein LOC104810063 n=1 Tax=Tarenaya hassleriana TaxID=28532 RepID=UPI00053C3ED5|nr:PREDICTED: uncharacterized protein LOC104810063 [Tarenaya hassleriana]